ncbi:NADH-quinone oxidoreductase subunit N [Aquimixticola soesokkakensis]|uniref:NADH-quinone oxidoreductase subunit N n=1 Tax=Aquimixticola soesokkakensis TaxID=1519096 RepID=A0A1Y5S2Z8_9RHOB|nr:NADH-quinone oxidoreductase subunit NuoN [Aquimixticola soesokkakensis]SLN30461.1 NADH-quinone oxidoreductase subunit N [Aquimixticola soesokkakensis]
MTSADFSAVLPEVLLALYAMAGLLFAVYTSKDKAAPLLTWVTAGVFVVLAGIIALSGGADTVAFNGLFIEDAFARFAKVTILLSGAGVLAISVAYLEKRDLLRFEYPVIVALATVGMMIMVSAGNLMTLYMGLELMSLSLYIIASFRRDSVKSTEAGLKYFVLGALSSGLLLYGCSLTYGFAGTTDFAGIASVATEGEISTGLLFGLVFVITGLAFKVSAVPFHMWTPDVYEGAPTPVTAFFATAPKVAAMGLFARVMFDAFGNVTDQWTQVVGVIAVASMFLGAFAAIGQYNIKRLMAYSSIVHMGFALLGLAAGTEAGVSAMLIYMAIYVTMNIGTFAFILTMERDGQPIVDIRALNLYWRNDLGRALAVMALMLSLAGVPPFLGFFGKFAVLEASVNAGHIWLATLGVIASVVGAYYYLRIVYYMFFGAETEALDKPQRSVAALATLIGGALMLIAVINLFGVGDMAATAAESLVR